MLDKRKRILILPVVVLLAALAVYAGTYFRMANGRTIRVSGNIETTDAEVSFKIAGRVEERLVDEGDMVTKGQLIAVLDTADLKADVALRAAELEAARQALAELKAGSRVEEKAASLAAKQRAKFYLDDLVAGSREQEIEAAKADLSAAEADADRLKSEVGRAAKLLEGRVIAREQYDFTKSAYEMATERMRRASEQLSLLKEGTRRLQIDQARAALDQATAQYDQVMAGPRQETIRQAEARVEQAKAALDLAEVRLGYAKVVSPLDGMVLSKNIEPGEYVAPGTPVVTVADMVHVWLRAYINETDLDRVKLNQRARLTIDDPAGKTYEGRVSFIASQAEFTPKTVQTAKERVKLVFRIKIDITNDKMELKPGMPADAELLGTEP